MKWLNSLKIKENPHGIEHVRITIWCPLTDSNRRPTAYKAVALPTELNGHQECIILHEKKPVWEGWDEFLHLQVRHC